jgi:hypothetical protein
MFQIKKSKILLTVSLGLFLVGCSMDLSPKEGQEAPMGREDTRKYDKGKLLGEDFLLFGTQKKYDPNGGGGMRVNHYLWQASLDVVSFMPLASSDAMGGVIVTDWYMSTDKPNERLKLIINISDRILRSDAVRVALYKQVKGRGGEWMNATVDAAVMRQMEDLILTKARELKVKNGKVR